MREALVVGGGLAGSMAALELARTGRRVVLLEKTKGPHDKVCGEFLSRESLHYLQRHNVDPLALGGVPIRSVRLIAKHFAVERELPFAAVSLTRRKLDEELLRLALLAGIEVHRDAHVDGMVREGSAWSAHMRDGRTLQTDDVLLATGKHDLRGWARPEGSHRGLVGFKMYYRLSAEQAAQLGHSVELTLFPGGYAGMQAVESGAANLCLLIQEKQLREAGANWGGLQHYLFEHAPRLAARLLGATPLLDAPLAASRIPYGHMQRATQDGLWRVGDQAAVIPSFCGDGMSIALHSGALAASYLARGLSAPAYQRALQNQLAPRLWAATRLSQALVALPSAAALVRVFPALLTRIALMTRIPNAALLRGHLPAD